LGIINHDLSSSSANNNGAPGSAGQGNKAANSPNGGHALLSRESSMDSRTNNDDVDTSRCLPFGFRFGFGGSNSNSEKKKKLKRTQVSEEMGGLTSPILGSPATATTAVPGDVSLPSSPVPPPSINLPGAASTSAAVASSSESSPAGSNNKNSVPPSNSTTPVTSGAASKIEATNMMKPLQLSELNKSLAGNNNNSSRASGLNSPPKSDRSKSSTHGNIVLSNSSGDDFINDYPEFQNMSGGNNNNGSFSPVKGSASVDPDDGNHIAFPSDIRSRMRTSPFQESGTNGSNSGSKASTKSTKRSPSPNKRLQQQYQSSSNADSVQSAPVSQHITEKNGGGRISPQTLKISKMNFSSNSLDAGIHSTATDNHHQYSSNKTTPTHQPSVNRDRENSIPLTPIITGVTRPENNNNTNNNNTKRSPSHQQDNNSPTNNNNNTSSASKKKLIQQQQQQIEMSSSIDPFELQQQLQMLAAATQNYHPKTTTNTSTNIHNQQYQNMMNNSTYQLSSSSSSDRNQHHTQNNHRDNRHSNESGCVIS
jgi:hypothetical protein